MIPQIVQYEMRKNQQKNLMTRFNTDMQKKLMVLAMFILLAFMILAVNLYLIIRDNGEAYKKQVYAQRSYASTPLPFKRGDIEDRKGSKLAYSEKVYNVILDSKLLQSDEGKYFEPTLETLKETIPSLDTAEIRQFALANPSSQYRVLAKKLPADTIQPYLDAQEEAKKEKTPLNGIWFEEDYKREYPYGSLACDVLGFTQGENCGYFGLEEYYNDVLNGTGGRSYSYINEDSMMEKKIKAAGDGNTIISTIDTNIQSIVEKNILKFSEEHRNEAREGAGAKNIGVIIMDPNTGEVLAMASSPAFNLQDPRNLDAYYSAEEQAQMDDEEKLQACNLIWRNFCISDTYEPGSTAKPFTVAAALEEGAIKGDETYNCGGALDVGGHTIHCHNRLGDGPLTVTQGIQKSCNVVLMNVAFALGREKWLKYNRLFNFGLKTNIDLAGEVNASLLVFNEGMGQTDLAVGSFGQGFNTTMIQVASGYCSLINGGYYYRPHMVSKIVNPEGATVQDIEPRVMKQTISNSTSDKIREMLKAVVMEGTEGTGYTARPAGYTMGGKTGTAEKVPRNKRNYVVSFVGFVPVDNPQVLSYVVIDEPNVPKQDQARFATLLTKDIMTEVLPYMNIFMTEELSDTEREELAAMQADFSLNTDALRVISQVAVDENGEPVEGEEGEGAEGEDGDASTSGDTQEDTADTAGDATEGGAPSLSVGGSGVLDGAEEDGVTDESITHQINYDPETGYPIDPNTGEVLDPETLLPIEGGGSFMD